MKNRIIGNRSGNTISVFINGEHFQFTCDSEDAAKEQFRVVVEAQKDPTDENTAALLKFVGPDYKVQVEGVIVQDRVGNYYLEGVNVPLPRALMRRMREQIENDVPIDNLVNFWKLLVLNPDQHIRESLFKFMEQFNMPITSQGYFIGYKSVAWAGVKNQHYVDTIGALFTREVANGHDPAKYQVWQTQQEDGTFDENFAGFFALHEDEVAKENDGMSITDYLTEQYVTETTEVVSVAKYLSLDKAEQDTYEYNKDLDRWERKVTVDKMPRFLGTVKDIFPTINKLLEVEGSEFTDFHTRKSVIKLGVPVSMKREDCDNNEAHTCSAGLHVGAPGYVAGFGYGRDKHVLACLVSPMNVVAIPTDYSYQKMRTCEYLPYAVCEFDEETETIKEIDTQYFEEDYNNHEMEVLKAQLEEYATREENVDEIDAQRIVDIQNRLVYLRGGEDENQEETE